jgi:hypothetical protein
VISGEGGKLTDHVGLGALTRVVPRYVVDEAVARCGRQEKRSRLLPSHVVVYFVLALSLFTDGYEEVVRKLVNGLRFARVWSAVWKVPTTGALSQARARLGVDPLRELFAMVAVPVATPATPGAWLRELRLMAIDGVMIDMPDTPENNAEFPRPGGVRRPFPQTRVVGLSEVGTHAVIGVEIGTMRTGERELAEGLVRLVGPGMVVVCDRGFFSFDLWRTYLATGTQLLWRISASNRLPVLQPLADGSYLSEITNQNSRSKTRIAAADVDDITLATHIPVRVVEYRVETTDDNDSPQTETFRLVTSILDPADATADELARTYHERWEIESAFREIEIYLRQGKGIRSKTPELVRQELYGLFLTHYAIRAFMTEAADTVDMDPDRLSFTRTINIIRRRITDPAAFSPRNPDNPPPARHHRNPRTNEQTT